MTKEEPYINKRRINYLSLLLLAAVACMLFIIYMKNEQKYKHEVDNTEQVVESNENTSDSRLKKTAESPSSNSTKKSLDGKDGDKAQELNQPQAGLSKPKVRSGVGKPNTIKTVSVHASLAMNYISKDLSLGEGDQAKKLTNCVDRIKQYEFTEASTCLGSDFGVLESHAEWIRALLALATKGESRALPLIRNVASDDGHIYVDQAKELLSFLE